MVQTEHLTP
ncbi:hypothetical protein GQ607_003777 [Colletotrichum asianum]|uniref:Uncharacterized protein n=1 Tax=Colletotrichum asianum TaxID=702518 RepID=A0A8H3ZQV2_9PEZI|nr:hypothetical protein GQ607_003777 [Colletotrichum asianum]